MDEMMELNVRLGLPMAQQGTDIVDIPRTDGPVVFGDLLALKTSADNNDVVARRGTTQLFCQSLPHSFVI